MCHYAKLTFPVPAVIVVTLSLPTVVVVPVRPAPMVIVAVDGYLRITTPEPPVPNKLPPPPPVLAVPAVPT